MATPFRWQSLMQRAGEALFLLNRQRRLLAVNPAWEVLTGFAQAQVRRLACTRIPGAGAGSPEAALAALAPPPEALAGQVSRVRRLLVPADGSRRWCDVEFLSFHDARGRLRLLGRLTPVENAAPVSAVPLSEKLAAVRQELARQHRFDLLDSPLPQLRRIADQARLASQTTAAVLIVGEAGSGKQWLARTIHFQSSTAERTFAAIDCVRLPPSALSEALFGTGGLTWRKTSGTIYLREPGALPRDLQVRLCEWLDDPRAERPRIVAGTARDPAAEIAAGHLLEELHCGLATVVIALPALRDRRDDLPALVERMLLRAVEDEKAIAGLAPDAWEAVQSYRWPGNLTELFMVLRRARARAAGQRIAAADLPAYLRRVVSLERTPGRSPPRPVPLDDLLKQVERRLILLALRRAEGKKSKAAESLGLTVPRLLRRMEALGIASQFD